MTITLTIPALAALSLALAAGPSPATAQTRAAGTSPAPSAPQAPPAATSAAPTAPTAAGVYLLVSASGVKPPVPFKMQTMAGALAGTINSARVTLAPDGTYTSEVVVHWTSTPVIPIPGLRAGDTPRAIDGSGRYTVAGSVITLQPGDILTRQVTHAVTARAVGKALFLTDASGGLAGGHVLLRAELDRTR